jgi:hypothetical protein
LSRASGYKIPKKEKASTMQHSEGNRYRSEVGDQHVMDRNPTQEKPSPLFTSQLNQVPVLKRASGFRYQKKEESIHNSHSQGNRFESEVGYQHVDRNPTKDKHQHSTINHSNA